MAPAWREAPGPALDKNCLAPFIGSTWTGKDDVPMPTKNTDRIFKYVLVLVGLAGMAVLGIWV